MNSSELRNQQKAVSPQQQKVSMGFALIELLAAMSPIQPLNPFSAFDQTTTPT